MWQQPGRDRDRRDRERDREREEQAAKAVALLATAAVLATLWPLLAVAAAALCAAWLTGMHPARLLRAAAWSLAMTAVYVTAAAVQDRPWAPGRLAVWARQPWTDYQAATAGLFHPARIPAALLSVAPVAVPAGLAIGAALWAWRTHMMTHGLMGTTALAPVSWDERQWRRQAAAARRDAAQPGRVPLASRRGIPAGTVIRTVRARWSRVLAVTLAEFSRHMVIVGATGSGKTTLMIRLWAGWTAAANQAARRGGPRPLLVVIDAKGGHDSRARAAETQAALAAAGTARFAVWPDMPLNMWDIAPRELAVLLHQLVEHGDGAARYYADASQAVIALAVHAPGGPPRSAAQFLDRLNPRWLEAAYAAGRPAELNQVTAAKPHLGDISMRYTVLLDRLGPALAGTARLQDADAWYCILEGTAEASVAEAQAMALIELVARAAVAGPRRRILLAADDYSAVSRRVPLSNLYERGRSLGLGVQVSAQSWSGLAPPAARRRRPRLPTPPRTGRGHLRQVPAVRAPGIAGTTFRTGRLKNQGPRTGKPGKRAGPHVARGVFLRRASSRRSPTGAQSSAPRQYSLPGAMSRQRQEPRAEGQKRLLPGWVRNALPQPLAPNHARLPEPVKETRLDRTRSTRGRQDEGTRRDPQARRASGALRAPKPEPGNRQPPRAARVPGQQHSRGHQPAP